MKLLFFISSLKGGGAERVMAVLTNELVARGHKVTIGVMTNSSAFYELNPAITIRHFNFKKNKSFLGKLRNRKNLFSFVRTLSKEEKPDVIISFIYQMNINVLLSTRFLNIPVIACEHNTLDRKMSFSEKIQRLYLSRMADRLTVLTQHDFNLYSNVMKNMVVMPNPLSFKSISAYNRDRENVVLAVGSIVRYKHKGFDNLIEIWGEIGDRYPEWKLKIAGGYDEESLEYLRKVEAKSEIRNKVEFLGQVTDVSVLLRKYSIFVLSSRWEGFPMVLMEAMSQGCTVCSYDVVSGPNEMIINNYDGVLVSNQNKDKMLEAITSLIEDETKRMTLATNAIESINKFSVENVVDKWENLLNDVTKS